MKAKEFHRVMRQCRTSKERGLMKRRWALTRRFCKNWGYPVN